MDNFEKLKKIETRYSKNREALGFTVEISSMEHKMTISFNHLDSKYKEALKKLTKDLLSEAKEYIAKEFKLDYLEEDEKLEYLRFDKTLCMELPLLYSNICNDGLEVFLRNVTFISTKYKQLYELANVKLVEGNLVDRKGNKIV